MRLRFRPIGRRKIAATFLPWIPKRQLCRILKLMPQLGHKQAELENIKRYALASAWLGALAKQTPARTSEPVVSIAGIEIPDRYTVGLARRLSEIVLTAVDAEDLHQALDEAFGHFEVYPHVLELEPKLLSSVTDPETPIECRELMLAHWFGTIAQMVAMYACGENRRIAPWLNAELARYSDAGERAMAQLINLVEQDQPDIVERHRTRREAFEQASIRASQSQQDVYSPFGNPDD